MARVPVVVVLGATGAGKSKLALEIAQRFGGEVISADAMQMYKGLDIVTNKVTQEERRLVKHHMIDFLDPMLRTTVVEFRNQANLIIDDLRKRNVMPVICGGTNYYIESLLWQVLVEKSANTTESACKRFKTSDVDDDAVSNSQLYERLKEQDPERANQLHPQERRKIIRSLQVIEKEGRKHSEILADQMASSGGSLLGGGLRYPRDQLAVLWVRCNQTTLDQRCDKRVEQMLTDGLLAELQGFHQDFNQKRGDTSAKDYTIGIFQSIGFKEFHKYLLLDPEKQENSEGQKAFREGKYQMMTATRRYARKQGRWIQQRFMRSDRQCPPIYAVDSTDPSLWEDHVQKPAYKVVQAYLDGDLASISHLALAVDPGATHSFEDTRQMFRCDVCGVSLKGRLQFKGHVKGRKHLHVLRKSKMRLRLSLHDGVDLESRKVQLEAVLRELFTDPSINIVIESLKDDQIEMIFPAKNCDATFREDLKAACTWIEDAQVEYFLSEKPKDTQKSPNALL